MNVECVVLSSDVDMHVCIYVSNRMWWIRSESRGVSVRQCQIF